MQFLLHIIFTSFVIAGGAITDEDFECFYDYDRSMFCQLTTEKSNCTRFNMSLNTPKGVYFCTFVEKNSYSGVSECGCSVSLRLFVSEKFTANLSLSGNLLTSKIFNVTNSIKLKAPTILSVTETKNRNFWAKWTTNYENVPVIGYIFQLSYRKKGETIEVFQNVSSTEFELDARPLKPNSTYVLKVRINCDLSGRFSDWSKDFEFHTAVAPTDYFTIVVMVVCIAVVLLTSAVFWYGVRLKAKWWDSVPKCSNPGLLHMVPGVPKVLDPPKIHVSSFYIDRLDVDVTEGKAWKDIPLTVDMDSGKDWERDQSHGGFPEPNRLGLAPAYEHVVSSLGSPDTVPHPSRGGSGCSSSSFDNITYFASGPLQSPELPKPSESSLLSTQPLHSNFSQRPTEADTFKRLHPELFLSVGQTDIDSSTHGAPVLQTDFSYLSCDGASGALLPTVSAEGAGQISVGDVTRVTEGFLSFSEEVTKDTEMGTSETLDMPLLLSDSTGSLMVDVNPCYSPVCSRPPCDVNYQVLQSLGPDGLNLIRSSNAHAE
ncbi:hypothetical protein DPEC_G00277960 [Dallia pectoralis]|uniref:Uncharacterized protein n=1 Tax=Dallia pectoralis TaxID=75939 RepID=A0ACC2FLW8_DALPE|nr:hypothetical protein DPEC_G00277960 [Dallia pectoralis]